MPCFVQNLSPFSRFDLISIFHNNMFKQSILRNRKPIRYRMNVFFTGRQNRTIEGIGVIKRYVLKNKIFVSM